MMNQSNIYQVQQQQISFLWDIISCHETAQVIIIKRSGLVCFHSWGTFSAVIKFRMQMAVDSGFCISAYEANYLPN